MDNRICTLTPSAHAANAALAARLSTTQKRAASAALVYLSSLPTLPAGLLEVLAQTPGRSYADADEVEAAPAPASTPAPAAAAARPAPTWREINRRMLRGL